MVVPFGGDNIVALIDPGRKLKVEANAHALDIKEVEGAEVLKRVMLVRNTFSEPDVDPQVKAAALPASFNGDARFFEIKGRKKPIGFPGLEVVARSAGKKIEAKLQVVVLDKITVKVAIRNVMVPGGGGVPVFHAKKPCSPQDEVLTVNNVWKAQASIAFELAPSDWLVIDDSQAAVKQELANAYGMQDASLARFDSQVQASKLKDMFKKFKVPGAHLTFFVVDQVWSNGRPINGQALSSHGIIFISSTRGPATFAHEAGHFLGGHGDRSKAWEGMDHTLEVDPKTRKENRAEDIKMLMRDGGADWKIPFHLVQRFRGFFDRHPEH
jgi:hypothetical protein